MSLAAQKRGPELVIFADREIDLSNAERFEERLDAARSRTRRICLDFTQCEFIDAGGLRLVLHTARDMRAEGGELSVDKLRGEVARIFEITGMLVEGSPVVRGAAQTPPNDSPG